MIDISKQTVKIDCPECKRPITVTLKQVANEALMKCNCGREIQLVDSNGTNKKAIRDINKSIMDIDKAFYKLGK